MTDVSAYERYFPYDEPYANQREAMDRIHTALERGQDVLFEGACGTGKTLSALAPALSVAADTDRTVVITTNVHQQMRQFVEEARAISEVAPVRAVVFKGKASMCHIAVGYVECQALRDTPRALVETEEERAALERRRRELAGASDPDAADARAAVLAQLEEIEDHQLDLEERPTCEHYRNNLTDDTGEFFEWLDDGVRRPEEIYDYAEEATLCGYELLKEGMEGVDLVVCNYHHLLDPMIRQQFFRWLGRDPEDIIAVFDEAHNLEGAARDHASVTCSERTLESALGELEEATVPETGAARNVLEAFRDALRETYEGAFSFGERERIGDDWEDLPIDNEDRRDDLTLAFLEAYSGPGIDEDLEAAIAVGQTLEEDYEAAFRRGETTVRRECQTLPAARFLERWLAESDTGGVYPVCSVRRDASTDEVYGRAELYSCLPGPVTSRLFDEVAASVLMSATLQPFDVTAEVLGVENAVTMAYGLEFPPENRRTYAVATPPLFAADRDDPEVQAILAETIRSAVEATPGNVLAFFPNYAEAGRYADRLDEDTTVYCDEPGVDVEERRSAFVEEEGALLCTSLWGTLSEGVSFDGDDARTVLVVGVPYPMLDDRAEAVQEAYEEAFEGQDVGWRYAVEIPTIRRTRQALGRVIRSPGDVGVRALLDARYCQAATDELGRYSVHDTIPATEREELIDVTPEKLRVGMRNFFVDHDAYDGSPPPI